MKLKASITRQKDIDAAGCPDIFLVGRDIARFRLKLYENLWGG
jgi:hypothetical protein